MEQKELQSRAEGPNLPLREHRENLPLQGVARSPWLVANRPYSLQHMEPLFVNTTPLKGIPHFNFDPLDVSKGAG